HFRGLLGCDTGRHQRAVDLAMAAAQLRHEVVHLRIEVRQDRRAQLARAEDVLEQPGAPVARRPLRDPDAGMARPGTAAEAPIANLVRREVAHLAAEVRRTHGRCWRLPSIRFGRTLDSAIRLPTRPAAPLTGKPYPWTSRRMTRSTRICIP